VFYGVGIESNLAGMKIPAPNRRRLQARSAIIQTSLDKVSIGVVYKSVIVSGNMEGFVVSSRGLSRYYRRFSTGLFFSPPAVIENAW
jgi:hypothetical protein